MTVKRTETMLIRMWAREQGLFCGTQGRVSDDLVRRYREAQSPEGKREAFVKKNQHRPRAELLADQEYQSTLLELLKQSSGNVRF
jgi:hypothetical protein